MSDDERVGVYLYPDYFTCVLGTWSHHVLVSGHVTQLREACREGDTWRLSFLDPGSDLLQYSPPSHYSLGPQPLRQDPYESRTVEVRTSQTEEADQGLFTRRMVMSGEVKDYI